MINKYLYHNIYRIEDEIAAGGFARVFKATMSSSQETVAIKMAHIRDDPVYAKSIREEARIISGLDHRNIVKLKKIPRTGRIDLEYARAIEFPGEPLFFVMEYLQGGTLQSYLDQVETLPPDEASAIALELARALDHMHLRRYYHNDLKLENIVFREPVEIGRQFTPVLIDFGIATRLRLQAYAGSIHVMSPERLQVAKIQIPPEMRPNKEEVDLMKVDVWCLGIVLYRMLGGKLPFTGRNLDRLTDHIMNSQPIPLHKLTKDIPAQLEDLVLNGCLAKHPNERVSMLDLGKQLSFWGNMAVASKLPSQKKLSWLFGNG